MRPIFVLLHHTYVQVFWSLGTTIQWLTYIVWCVVWFPVWWSGNVAKHDDVTEKSYYPTPCKTHWIIMLSVYSSLVLCMCMIEPNLTSCAITGYIDHWFMHMVETVFLFRVPALYHIYVWLQEAGHGWTVRLAIWFLYPNKLWLV